MSTLMPIAAFYVRDQASDLAYSALPDAPVRPEAPPRRAAFARSRTVVARGLQTVARAVEPAPRWQPSR